MIYQSSVVFQFCILFKKIPI